MNCNNPFVTTIKSLYFLPHFFLSSHIFKCDWSKPSLLVTLVLVLGDSHLSLGWAVVNRAEHAAPLCSLHSSAPRVKLSFGRVKLLPAILSDEEN